MLKIRAIGVWPQPPPSWREVLGRMRQLHLTEIEQEEGYCLEAMLHWHDPEERTRTFRCRRRHSLIDDNPASG